MKKKVREISIASRQLKMFPKLCSKEGGRKQKIKRE